MRPEDSVASALLRRLDGETHTAVPVSNMMPVKIDTHFAGDPRVSLVSVEVDRVGGQVGFWIVCAKLFSGLAHPLLPLSAESQKKTRHGCNLQNRAHVNVLHSPITIM